MKALILIFLLGIHLPSWSSVSSLGVQEGDVIFHESQSSQSEALKEITGSRWTHTGIILKHQGQWYVAEAARGVEMTPLMQFISRGKNRDFIIKRVRENLVLLHQENLNKLKMALLPFAGVAYDFWFEWSDEKIYCSELVWKAYKNAFNLELATPERFKDFPLNGPWAQRLILDRYTRQGRSLNLDELVVSPVALLDSPQLQDVFRKE
jgi:hypothetical protein